jgi:hypothetical protein
VAKAAWAIHQRRLLDCSYQCVSKWGVNCSDLKSRHQTNRQRSHSFGQILPQTRSFTGIADAFGNFGRIK